MKEIVKAELIVIIHEKYGYSGFTVGDVCRLIPGQDLLDLTQVIRNWMNRNVRAGLLERNPEYYRVSWGLHRALQKAEKRVNVSINTLGWLITKPLYK